MVALRFTLQGYGENQEESVESAGWSMHASQITLTICVSMPKIFIL